MTERLPFLRFSRRRALFGLAALPLAGCQVAPGTGREGLNFVSLEEERRIGRETHPKILEEFGGPYRDESVQAYVAGLGQTIAAKTEMAGEAYRFTVLNTPIVNAMAVPGGYVYVTRGLLALIGNEAELAGVLGHELGHLTARHSALRYSRAMATNIGISVLGAIIGVPGVSDIAQLGAEAWLQAYSRDDEFEADSLGVRYMSRGGYHPQAMVSLLGKLMGHSRLEAILAGRSPDAMDEFHFMATHPRTADRVQAAIDHSLKAPPQGVLGAETLLARLDGLVWGDDPSQGVIRGNAFLHPDLGLRFEVPEGFRLINGTRAVAGLHPNGSSILFDGGRMNDAPDMPAYIARIWHPKADLVGMERIEINGQPAATATTRGRSKRGAVDVRLVAVRFDNGSVYRFTFATPPELTAAMAEPLRRTTHSLRPLTAAERKDAEPVRLRLHTVGAKDSVESLAGRMAVASHKIEHFRLLNGLDDSETPPRGAKVKLLV